MKSDVKSFYIILTIKIMLMNVLLNMRMFGLFSETSQEATNNEMQEAYGEFVEQIRTIVMEMIIQLLIEFLQLPVSR